MPHVIPILLASGSGTVLGARAFDGPDLTRYFLVCGLLIAGLGVGGLFFRRLLRKTLQGRAAKRSLQVLDVLPLGGKQRLLVVRCYDRSFLLGQGEKELRSIAELDAEALAEEATEAPDRGTPGAFRAALRRAELRPEPRSPARERPVIEEGGILG